VGNDGRILLHCHAGCEIDRILEAAGIDKKVLFPANGNGHKQESKIVATYDYQDESGNLSYQVVRYEPKDFRQRRPDGNGGWLWKASDMKRLPYNLPELLTADYPYIVEGEKDVKSLREIKLVGTCIAGGAKSPDWPIVAQYFRPDQHVTILPDNDEPGEDYAKNAATALYGKVASLKILRLEGLRPKGDVSDWLQGRDALAAAEELCRLSEAAAEWKPRDSIEPKIAHVFEQDIGNRYRLVIPESRISIEVDRLRRESNELIGELCVRCDLPGVPTYGGSVSIADFNLSSARARSERARLLETRAHTKGLDWAGHLEEFCQRSLAAERMGLPAVDLRDMDRPGPDDSIFIEGVKLPRRHPSILFGDGGAAKSYIGLYLAGRLVQQGFNVALFDWELAGEDHRDRLERIFGSMMPKVYYARCERALVHEGDRLLRIVRDNKIDFAIFDSIAFACDGPPESAEIAGRYFRAVRQVGIGSLHIAHITKSEGGDQKPFGSVFWHNGARATYFVTLSNSSQDGKTLSVGLFNRKTNLGALNAPAGFTIEFTNDRTYFTKANPADTPDLAEKMTVRQRMDHLLRGGALAIEDIAKEIEAEPATISRTVRRYKRQFTLIEGGKVALLQRVS
jgi:hypothetical protein